MTEAPVTDLDLAEVERLLEAATPGPWGLSQRGSVVGPQAIPHDNPTMNRMLVCDEVSAEDAAFIAAARTLVPALVARVRELEAAQAWRPIETAPRDKFILLGCPDDQSVWLAKWQGGDWYGVDDEGLTRIGNLSGASRGRWTITHWLPLPAPPDKEKGETDG